MRVIYRISDSGYNKVKPDYINNEACLRNAILKHKSQNPKRFVELAILMNSYRAAQCNAPKGVFAEAYFFERSFPFADIRNILPSSIDLRPFHIKNVNGFL